MHQLARTSVLIAIVACSTVLAQTAVLAVDPITKLGAKVEKSPDAGGAIDVVCVSGCSSSSGPSATTDTQGPGRDGGYGWDVDVSHLGGAAISEGQKAMAASVPVVLASDQPAVPVSLASIDVTDRSARLVGHVTLDNASIAVTGTFWPTAAASPNSTELSDGAAFYTAAKTGQLPSALVGGRLDANIGAWLGSTAPTVGSKTAANSVPVVIASDQGAVPVSGTVTTTPPSNASTNVAQFGGTNVSTGTGAGGVGVPRVTISNDSSLAANQSVNVAQIAGAATSTAASGIQKVGITGNAGAAVDAANNAAAPANVIADGFEAQSSALGASATAGNVRRGVAGLDGVLYSRQGGPLLFSGGLTAIAATLTQIVAAPAAGTSLYLTDVFAMSDTATAGSFLLRYGTGSNCATGATTLWPNVASLTAGKVVYPANTAFQPPMTFTTPLKVPAANALCIICVATNTCTASVHGYTAP